MRPRLYLIDGMSHVYRAYYAIQGLANRQGLPTNAVYGFTAMLRKLIKDEQPEYLGVAVDLAGPTVRHEQYDAYKATRRPMPEDLVRQLPYIQRVCDAFRVPVLSYPKYEADDVIGTLARQAAAHDLDVVIVTIDKDMFQLVSDRVAVLDTRTMTRLDPAGVEARFGVPPGQVVDVLSLVGDSSDNIAGAPGIGDKGGRQLIRQFGSLENLLKNRSQVERKAYRESLEQNEAQILQSRELVTIHTGLPLDLNLSELALAAPDVEASRQLFTELEFTSLLDEFLPTAEVVGEAYAAVQNLQELGSLAARLKGRQAALALELASDEYLESPVLGVAVSDRPGQAWYLPEDLLRRHPDATIQALASPAGWAIHDLKPLCFVAQRHGWPTPVRAFDTALAAYLLFPNQADYSLRKLAIEQLGVSAEGGEDTDAELGRTEQACRRADLTLRLWPVLETQLGARRLDELLWKVEIPLVEVLAAMEEAGVRVDCDVLRAMSEEMETEIQRLTSDIYRLAGEEFNINSPRQLADVLFEKLRLPQSKKTRKAGHFATGVEVLEQLAQSHELPRKVLEYRELSKLKGTYLDALPRLVNPRTERIHTRFNQMVASTGRLSSSNPNLQNIPMKSDLGRKMRRAFVAGPGCRILAADYSQIELRVMAHLSQDQSLVEAFNRQEDIHERTAREVFGMHAAMNPQEFRRLAKVINFGIIYGLSAFGLARTLKIERLEAQRYIDDYFRRYSGVKKWIDWTIEQARSTGCVTTLFGRIRQIPEIASSNWTLRSFGERTAVNAPIQGTAADLIKIAMVSLFREMRRRGLRSKMIMQVHDELVFEVEESELDVMRPLVRQQMEGAAQLSVPLKVGLAEGPTWLEAK